MAAARAGSAGIVALLLDARADVSPTDRIGWPAIHHALHAESEEMARLLLAKDEAGAEAVESVLEKARQHVRGKSASIRRPDKCAHHRHQ